MSHFSPREALTTIDCPHCKEKLLIKRDCRQVHMSCPKCKRAYPLADFIGQADEAMENFLENVYFDRI